MKKAIIAISGGIDSTVAAGIAKKEGYEIIIPLKFTLNKKSRDMVKFI